MFGQLQLLPLPLSLSLEICLFYFPVLGLSSTISPYMNLMWSAGVSSEVSYSMNISSAFNAQSSAIPVESLILPTFTTVVLYTFPRKTCKKIAHHLDHHHPHFQPDSYLLFARHFKRLYWELEILWQSLYMQTNYIDEITENC